MQKSICVTTAGFLKQAQSPGRARTNKPPKMQTLLFVGLFVVIDVVVVVLLLAAVAVVAVVVVVALIALIAVVVASVAAVTVGPVAVAVVAVLQKGSYRA